MGHETAKYFPKTDNVEKALKELSEILGRQYNFELYKPKDKDSYIITENGETFIYLVFRDCLVRQTLRREGMAQKGPAVPEPVRLHGRRGRGDHGQARKAGDRTRRAEHLPEKAHFEVIRHDQG